MDCFRKLFVIVGGVFRDICDVIGWVYLMEEGVWVFLVAGSFGLSFFFFFGDWSLLLEVKNV